MKQKEVRGITRFLHIDKTHALRPLHIPAIQDSEELPETFPTGS